MNVAVETATPTMRDVVVEGVGRGGYFLAASALAAASAYFLVKRSTRPAVSISFCLPVKKGWQFEQISTRSISPLGRRHSAP